MRDSILHLLQQKTVTITPYIMLHYRQLGLTSDEFILFVLMTNEQTDISELAKIMQLSEIDIMQHLQNLVNKKLVDRMQVTLPDGKIDFNYSFLPLQQKATTLLIQENAKKEEPEQNVAISKLIEDIEQEFGRELAPLQVTQVRDLVLLDQYSPDLIRVALKEMSLNQARSLKYLQAILDNWKAKSIKTAQEAENYLQKYRKRKVNEAVVLEDLSELVSHDTVNWFK